MSDQRVDLTNCDREPIHIPGLIQPHGVLLVVQASTLKIIQVSNNTQEWLERSPQEMLGQPLSSLLNSEHMTAIQQCLAGDFESMNPLDIYVECGGNIRSFDGIVHQSDDIVLLELEQKTTPTKPDFFEFYQQVRGSITKIQRAQTLREMSQVVVHEVRKITGFDRVMVYQFDTDGAGSVIAEDTDHETPYLNLRYPATDIPQQARHLYTLNWLRLIPKADYQPVSLTPTENPLTGKPLDLSLSVLRSVSPLHVEYMQNMGITASMSISLVQDQQLWGLIACHHSSPHYVPYNIRIACEFIGQVMSVELANKIAHENLDYKMALKSLQTSFVESLSQSQHLIDGLVQLESKLLDLVSATGAVVCMGDRWQQFGITPPASTLQGLLNCFKPHLHHSLFHTQCLSRLYPEAEAYHQIASGMLALEISKVHQNYILWFRPEVLQTVEWGGNPNKPVEVHADGTRQLSPRKSFEIWQETVRGTSLPWHSYELEIVTELRSLIVGIVLRQADELASMNIELQRSNEELDSFAYIASHDLKEPLRGIHNYANFLMEDHGEVLNQDGIAKLQTMVRLTQRMEDLINSLLHFSRLGRAELLRQPVNLDELLHQVIATLSIARPHDPVEFRVPRPLPTVMCDRAQLNELFTNLISNAIKYNDKSEKWVEIGYLGDMKEETFKELEQKSAALTIFYVRDNGIGISKEYLEQIFQIFRRLHGRDEFGGGTGAGLTIARKIAERHGGKIWVDSIPEQGSTFYFTLAAEEIA